MYGAEVAALLIAWQFYNATKAHISATEGATNGMVLVEVLHQESFHFQSCLLRYGFEICAKTDFF